MGVDVYVGSLTRYLSGDWLTIVQQAGVANGQPVEIVRETQAAPTEPGAVHEAVSSWCRDLCSAHGSSEWPERPDGPYWTDKPDWQGFGGLLLLAAYEEQPGLDPRRRSGLFGKKNHPEHPANFATSPAFQAAAQNPQRYPSLLGGIEWWLPLTAGPAMVETSLQDGRSTRVGRVDQLLNDLLGLSEQLGLGRPQLETIRAGAAPSSESDVDVAGRFGLAVFANLAFTAYSERQPLLLDY